MKTRTKTWFSLVLLIVIAIVATLLCIQLKPQSVFADEVDISAESTDEYVITDVPESVAATYNFIKLNETECSVRIDNKDEATKAIIPSVATIDGEKYSVTEIASSGFASCPNLIRVSLPKSVKIIGSSAFRGCDKLKRINLANVEEIGNSAFYKCPELSEIVIPKSTKKMGSYVFRNNNTKVRIREGAAIDEWTTSWNKYNENQDFEKNSKYIPPLELETIHSHTARSANEIIGLSVASGQPRNEIFYGSISVYKRDNATIKYNNNIFIPAQYNDIPITNIEDSAFVEAEFDQLFVEYSPQVLNVASNAFSETNGTSIVINRPINFFDEEQGDASEFVFYESHVTSIVLPNNITKLENSMFEYCAQLANINFAAPIVIDENYTDLDEYLEVDINNFDITNEEEKNNLIRERELCIIKREIKDENRGIVYIPGNSQVVAIGNNVFSGTTAIRELYLNDTIQEVGSFILNEWSSDQKVHVNNKGKLVNWHKQWNGTFTNVEYDKEFFTITFDPGEGHFINSDEATKTIDVVFGEPIPDFPEVEKEYSELNNWKDETGQPYQSGDIYNTKSNIVLTASWEDKKYRIDFDPQGGEGGTKFIEVSYREQLPEKTAPTKIGYTFKGYYEFPQDVGEGTRYYYDDMRSTYVWNKTENITIYAHWNPKEYEVSLCDGFTGETVSKIESQKYEKELPKNLSIPEKLGYKFNGYYDGMDSDSNQYYDSNMQIIPGTVWDKAEDSKLYSHWTIETYTIKYEIEDMRKLPSNYNNPNPKSYTIEDVREKPIIIQSVDTYGYTINWDIDKIDVNSTGNITIHGTLKLNEYAITYDLNGGSSEGNNPKSYNVENAGKLNDAIHATLYFKAWTLNGSKITSLVGLYKDITLVATWTDVKTIHITQSFQELVITDPKVSIIMDVRFTNDCVIKVASSVTMVGINGNGGVYNMSIVIEARQSNFGLYLHYIGLIAPQGKYAIQMSSNYTLYLYHTSTVVIKGHSPTTGNGSAAIRCYQLVIDSLTQYGHYIEIHGGKGSDGVNGVNGGHGGHGGVAIIAEKVTIACDYVIIAGGLPGKGGNSIGGTGYKGYGGYGAYPVNEMQIKTKIYITSAFANVRILISKPGADGIGKDLPNGRPSDIYVPTDPDFNPDPLNPDIIINPPIGDKIPTPGPFIPPISYV